MYNDCMRLLGEKELWVLSGTFLITFLLSFFAMVLFIGPTFIKVGEEEVVAKAPPPQVVPAKVNLDDDQSVNIVLLGQGGVGHDGGGLSDAIILLNINPIDKKTKIISIPRDLWVKFQGQENKINHAFVEGPGAIKEAITTVTGIRPEYFLAIDFNSFQQAVDELGGVTVNVPVAFDDHYYPIKGLENESCGFSPDKIQEVHQKYSGFELEKQFECRYEHLHFEQGPQKMDGATALKFVRSRHSSQHGGDFSRSERQQALLMGVKDTLFSLEAFDNVPKFFERMRGFVNTDLDVSHAVAIAEMVVNPKDFDIQHITLTTDDVLSDGKSSLGAYILFPKAGMNNWTEVQEYISSH